LKLALEIKKSSSGTALKDFVVTMESSPFKERLHELKAQVEAFASQFPLPVHNDFK